MPLQTRRNIVTTKNSSDQHRKLSGGEKGAEERKKETQSQEERAQAEEKGEEANAKEEERQQAEVTRRVAGTVAPYVEPPRDKAPRLSLGVP
jgi:hypothetical protein